MPFCGPRGGLLRGTKKPHKLPDTFGHHYWRHQFYDCYSCGRIELKLFLLSTRLATVESLSNDDNDRLSYSSCDGVNVVLPVRPNRKLRS